MASGFPATDMVNSDITTLMIRNVPTAYSQDMLIEEVQGVLGTSDLFDFLYLPWDSTKGSNCGFAFINFVNNEAAAFATHSFQNYYFVRSLGKPCVVRPARMQGAAANIQALVERTISNAVRHDPAIFWKGQVVDLRNLVNRSRFGASAIVELLMTWASSRDALRSPFSPKRSEVSMSKMSETAIQYGTSCHRKLSPQGYDSLSGSTACSSDEQESCLVDGSFTYTEAAHHGEGLALGHFEYMEHMQSVCHPRCIVVPNLEETVRMKLFDRFGWTSEVASRCLRLSV